MPLINAKNGALETEQKQEQKEQGRGRVARVVFYTIVFFFCLIRTWRGNDSSNITGIRSELRHRKWTCDITRIRLILKMTCTDISNGPSRKRSLYLGVTQPVLFRVEFDPFQNSFRRFFGRHRVFHTLRIQYFVPVFAGVTEAIFIFLLFFFIGRRNHEKPKKKENKQR